jgi:excisionase family DNA binding protein
MSPREQQALASALVELLASSPLAIARLRELVKAGRTEDTVPQAAAYTVASLAAVLGVSTRVVRGAITRGELDAVKRGGRWIIGAPAVGRWAEADARPISTRQGARRAVSASGPLTAVMALLDTGANLRSGRL